MKISINTDAISLGQLLLEFFEFYGFTFENDKYAIDIRHTTRKGSDEPLTPDPFRVREDLIKEA